MSKRFKKVYIEITNICNLSCSFCPKTQRKQRCMSIAEFEHVIMQVRAYTDYIYLHLMGEPLLHSGLEQLLKICAKHGVRVNLTTNGVLIAQVQDMLIASPALRKVSFSLHSFEANRASCPLSVYLGEIFSFANAAQQAGILCELRLWNKDAADKSGANMLNAQIVQAVEEWLGSEAEPAAQEQRSIKLGDGLYLSFAQIFDWPELSREDRQSEVFCYGLRDHIGILVDGTVVPCCLDSEGTLTLGNLLEQPLAQILESPRAKELYSGFSQRHAREELCRCCGYARRF